jgi:hypothetical protein
MNTSGNQKPVAPISINPSVRADLVLPMASIYLNDIAMRRVNKSHHDSPKAADIARIVVCP